MDSKVCGKCHDDLPLDAFTQRKDGRYQSWCRACNKAYNLVYFEKNRARHNEYVGHKKNRKTVKCRECGLSEPDTRFYRRRDVKGGTPRGICNPCSAIFKEKHPHYKRTQKQLAAKREKDKRKLPESLPLNILTSSRRYDRKHSLTNDLTLPFVKETIDVPCTYCGSTDVKMTLDRVDNSIGHTQANVKPSCLRCNWARRDMPYEAWELLIPALHRAQAEGKFGDWHAGPKKAPQKFEQASVPGNSPSFSP
jgi:hypothetical protein